MGRIRRGLASGVWIFVVLAAVFGVVLNVPVVRGSGTIYIRADGSVEGTTYIVSNDNVTYVFTADVNDSIEVQRSNIVIDGAGYTLQGSGSGNGFYLSGINNVTIKNTNIKDFDYSILLEGSSNHSITGNNITNNYVGIYLHASSNNNIANNTVTNNRDFGIWLRESSVNRISGNNITNNMDGIDLFGSSNNTISGNLFMRDGLSVWDSYGNVVVDNFVNGKPLVYLEDVSHQSVGDAGQVILVNCQHITVENLNPSNTNIGVQLWQTNNTIIQGNHITENNAHGIWLYKSSNNSVIGNSITNNGYGIYLYESSNNSVSGNNVTNNYYSGIVLPGPSNNNSILGNNVTANYYHGISLSWSSNDNSVHGNNITNNEYGIHLYGSSNNNIISGNNITENNDGGILLSDYSSSNTIAGNLFTNNGLYVLESYGNFVEDNFVNGEPLVYLEGVSHQSVGEAGQVTLVNCEHIQVKNLNLSHTTVGIQLWKTNNTIISGNNIANCGWYGIKLDYSSNNNIQGNNITNNSFSDIYFCESSNNSISGNNITANNYFGIALYWSSINTISGNNITNHGSGIYLWGSSNNTMLGNDITNNADGIWLGQSSNYNNITGNNITKNEYGIELEYSLNNRFSHNNFVDNTQQVFVETAGYANVWDDGYPSGGNYWSDYTGVDENSGQAQHLPGSDGIGDNPYDIDADNIDRYPLMAPFNTFDAGTWNGVAYTVDIVSNSSVSNFQVDTFQKTINFNVTGLEETAGFCRITIPNVIVQDLWQGNYTVLLNGEPWPFRNWTDATNTYIYINYTHSEHQIIIIPEFPLATILPLFMILSIIAVVFTKKKRKKQRLDFQSSHFYNPI